MYILVKDCRIDGERDFDILKFETREEARKELAKLVKEADYAKDIPTVDEIDIVSYVGQVIETNTEDEFSAYLNSDEAHDHTYIFIKEI